MALLKFQIHLLLLAILRRVIVCTARQLLHDLLKTGGRSDIGHCAECILTNVCSACVDMHDGVHDDVGAWEVGQTQELARLGTVVCGDVAKGDVGDMHVCRAGDCAVVHGHIDGVCQVVGHNVLPRDVAYKSSASQISLDPRPVLSVVEDDVSVRVKERKGT